MLRLAVLVSGGGTNLQAILDAIDEGIITNAEVSVVISNNAGAYALERAKKKESSCWKRIQKKNPVWFCTGQDFFRRTASPVPTRTAGFRLRGSAFLRLRCSPILLQAVRTPAC